MPLVLTNNRKGRKLLTLYFGEFDIYIFEEIGQMPKQKTHKGLRKRIKITAGGKVKHRRAGGSHLMSDKNAKRQRRIGSSAIMAGVYANKIKAKMLEGSRKAGSR